MRDFVCRLHKISMLKCDLVHKNGGIPILSEYLQTEKMKLPIHYQLTPKFKTKEKEEKRLGL